MNINLKNQVLYNSGTTIHIMDNFKIEDKLPIKNYQIKINNQSGEIYLSESNSFKLPEKLYGDFEDIEYYLKSFESSEKNIGIYLQGEKGTGKTLFAHKLCIDSNRPVIMVDDSSIFTSPNIFDFLNSEYLNNSILLFDEFEKTFNQEKMNNALLNLIKIFDGNLMSKFMFIVTSNTDNINEFFKNRLNRIKYRKVYSTLSDQTIENIIDDMLVYKNYKEELLIELNDLNFITMDILINIIKDINLFNLPPSVIFPKLNLYKLPQIMKSYFKIDGDYLLKENGIRAEVGSFINDYGLSVENILDIKNTLKDGKNLMYGLNTHEIQLPILQSMYNSKYILCLAYYNKKQNIYDFYYNLIKQDGIIKEGYLEKVENEFKNFIDNLDMDIIHLLNHQGTPDEFIDKYLKNDIYGLCKMDSEYSYGSEVYPKIFRKAIELEEISDTYYELYQEIKEVDNFNDVLTPTHLKNYKNGMKYMELVDTCIKNVTPNKNNDTLGSIASLFYDFLNDNVNIKVVDLIKVDKLNYVCDLDISYISNVNDFNFFKYIDFNNLKKYISICVELLPNVQTFAYSDIEKKLNSIKYSKVVPVREREDYD